MSLGNYYEVGEVRFSAPSTNKEEKKIKSQIQELQNHNAESI